jgi:carbohydrate kinase (thermoresistant glucokinase family)
MAAGLALSDEDRRPWLQALHEQILSWDKKGTAAVLACSALKQGYRDLLAGDSQVDWIYLKGEPRLVEERLKDRRGHFAKADLLASQFETLEEPTQALWIDIQEEPDMIVERIVRWMEERR